MKIQSAQRKRAKIKMGIQGPSGAGKTMSALLIAFGLCKDWSKIVVIDTENESSHLYAHLGNYNVLPITSPHSPEKYIEALELCQSAQMEVIIIDSITHEWEYLLDYHASLQGNSFTNWNKITPRHNEFIQKILQSTCHVISTIRTKQDYVLNEKNGKMIPEKIGLKSVQRDGLEYEFTLVFDVDIKNYATTSKDRTGLFFGKPEQKITVETGIQIRNWCNKESATTIDEILVKINDCTSIPELIDLYHQYPDYKEVLKPEFEQRKRKILINQEVIHELTPPKINKNGTSISY